MRENHDRFSHDLNILFWTCIKYEYVNKVQWIGIISQSEGMKTCW